jgi:C4-dicarboxylate transporter DctQ subunit
MFHWAGRIFDRIIGFAYALAGILIVFVLSAVFYEIVMRYFFHQAVLWTYEVTGFTMLFITFLATTQLLRKEGHVRVDVVVNELKPQHQYVINGVVSVLCAITFLMITTFATRTTIESAQIGYYTPTELQVPQQYILFIIPVGSFLLSIQFIRRAYVSFRMIKNHGPQ